jgi:hypothetical protein
VNSSFVDHARTATANVTFNSVLAIADSDQLATL